MSSQGAYDLSAIGVLMGNGLEKWLVSPPVTRETEVGMACPMVFNMVVTIIITCESDPFMAIEVLKETKGTNPSNPFEKM